MVENDGVMLPRYGRSVYCILNVCGQLMSNFLRKMSETNKRRLLNQHEAHENVIHSHLKIET